MKKTTTIPVVLLLLLSSIFPTVLSYEVSSNNIIYVDDDGTADYIRIQDAIDNATNGDIVYVYNGTYFENITINKSIKMIGEDSEKTVIDGKNAKQDSTNIILIKANDVLVDTFLLINSNESDFNLRFDSGISIINSSNVKINNTSIIGCRRGISLIHSKAIITNNKIVRTKNFGDTGIGVWYSDANVSYNFINGNYSLCIYSGLSNTTILKNIVGESNTYGIHVSDSQYVDGTQIIGNLIQRNNYGLFIEYCNSLNVENNTFLNNRLNAMFNNCIFTRWNGNYWDKSRIMPKPILGFIWVYPSIPILNFDWHPAQEQYDI